MSKNKVKRNSSRRRQAMHRGKETSTKPKKPVTRRKDFSASGKGKKRKKRRVHKMKPWQIALICVGAFIAALLAFGLMYVYAKWSKIDTKSIKADDIIINEEVKKNKNVDLGDGYTNVALFGVDSRDGDLGEGNRTDCIIVASLNNKTKEIKMVSVYRDTLLDLSEGTYQKCNTIPEYVFAQYEDPNIPQNDIVEKLREAAHCIYKIKDFQLMKQWCVDKDINAYNELKKSSTAKRGEFGELLLHLILREFKHTIPLISKVYFKDSASVPAHGFDAVHVSTNEKILWLGESKLYDDSKEGIKALVKDLNEHINTDYLNDQFVIIKKNLDNNSIPGREEWIDTITNCTKLSDKLNIINIPMLCTYTHDIYKKFSDMNDPNAIAYHELNVRELKEYFDKQNKMPLKDRVNIILMLFPVNDKNELVINLHKRLWHMQNI